MERNLELEQNALGTFRQKYGGKNPDIYNNPKERAEFYSLVYPDEESLPAELKGTVDYSLLSTGLPQSSIDRLRGEVEEAKKGVQELGRPKEAMRVLEEAIRTKAGFKNAPLGKSKIFEEAGVEGMGALSQSLAARGQELEMNRIDFRNTIKEMTGNYKDMANMAMFNYNASVDAYNKEKDYLDRLETDLRNHEQSIELLNLKSQIDKEIKRDPSIAEQLAAREEGYDIQDGGLVKMRTDRHNNPTAFTTDLAAQAGLIEGVDYEKGDPFPNNPNLFTAKLLGDPVETTIDLIDRVGFFTEDGKQRWSHTAMKKEDWDSLSNDDKRKVVQKMYKAEGGSGELFGEGGSVESLSPTAKLFYNGKYIPKTPSAYDAMVNEISAAGLELPMDLEPKAIIQGVIDSYNLLTKIPDSKRGQIQGRFQEWTKGEERDKDIQAFKSTASMVGMFMARLIEKGRMSDQDRKFYLEQMPNLRQSSNEIAEKSKKALIEIISQKFNINLSSFNKIKLQSPDGEIREGDWSSKEVKEAISQGYKLIK